MAVKRRLKREGSRVPIGCAGEVVGLRHVVGGVCVNGPDARCVVGAAGCEVSDVGGEEDACDVGAVGKEFADG